MPLQEEVRRSLSGGYLARSMLASLFIISLAIAPHIGTSSRSSRAPVSLVLLFAFYATLMCALHNAVMERWNVSGLYACQLFRLSERELYGDVKP